MLFPLSSLFPGWLELQKKIKKMVECQVNLDLWLQDASLFRDEPTDSVNTSVNVFGYGKSDTEVQTALSQPGLDWFDEKLDLSVLDNLDSLVDHHNETKPLMEDDSAFLLSLLDSSFNPSYFTADLKNEDIDFNKPFETHNFIDEPASSENLDFHLASPQCNLLQVNSPTFFPLQSPGSPYSDISEGFEESSSGDIVQSADSSLAESEIPNKDFDPSQINVAVCNVNVTVSNVTNPVSPEPTLSIDEVTRSGRKRKVVNYGDEIPKVKVIITDYPSFTSSPKGKDRRERKKVQNKEAAARYRIKKRMEDKELSNEVDGLESQQKELKEKHDELQSEIKYLKSLMCEILQKKGILK
jgi:hypothetical protein